MMRKIRGAWRSFDAATQAEVYSGELIDMEKSYGREKVELGIIAAVRTEPEFAPTPAKLRQYISASQIAVSRTDENCPDCKGTGWQPMDTPSERRVQRCHCWRKERIA